MIGNFLYLLQEAMNFLGGYKFVSLAIYSTKGCIRLKLRQVGKFLSESLNAQFGGCDLSKEVSQSVL